MDEIYILEGNDLEWLKNTLGILSAKGTLHSIRINPRGSGKNTGFAIKINEGMWSPTIGRREV